MNENIMKNGMPIVTLLLAGIPILGFMLGFMGMVPLPVYVFVPMIPMLLIFTVMTIKSRTKAPDFSNKIISSIWIGFLGTLALDIFRIMSVKIGWLPMDVPLALGAKIVGMDPMKMDMEQGMMGPWLAGNIYHLLIGISFTLVYILLVGKGNIKLGILFGILIWIGMMVLPPMPMMVGFFGMKTGGMGLAFGTLIAHIAFGLVVGLLAKRFVKSKGLLL
ncbi:hypothetical protein E3U55_12040 [Filobacillus milosensis]|uniref:Uncharacterized protein n=1 Tax=Filobacillus milosensis TaxID=94137 RepID=A0A4Y8IM01_9BACI|nr:DUF6789 family protein [Filobacillus milosensis]TFB18515.1 hypothetical protein E3U55_12040 [Filobacillus milosensis]